MLVLLTARAAGRARDSSLLWADEAPWRDLMTGYEEFLREPRPQRGLLWSFRAWVAARPLNAPKS